MLPFVLASPAGACGAFTCFQAPVLQAAERVVFGIDDRGGEVEMHVQITYAGADDEFAWIVPTPAEPELFLTTDALFNVVTAATAPTFVLDRREVGRCAMPQEGCGADFLQTGVEFKALSAPPPGVVVEDERNVGPYETVTLRAATAEDLLGWLDTEGYTLPPGLEAALPAYVAEVSAGAGTPRESWFVALKLAKDQDTGDLAPLGLRYRAENASIPVQLTSVSATPGMRLEVYAFAGARVVPESYLHVAINEAAVDWWSGGANYEELIGRAADEAGGHAFATDYYGPSSVVPTMWVEQGFDEGALRAVSTPEEWLGLLAERFTNAVTPPELLVVVEEALGLDAGDGARALQCACAPAAAAFDAASATDAVMDRVVEPMRAAQSLLDRFPELTRLTSSLDAAEMTVDPLFSVNPDATEPVPNVHRATIVYECDGGRVDRAPRRLELADGRRIALPTEEWLDDHGQTEIDYLDAPVAAQRIEQWGAAGPAEVLVDHAAELWESAGLPAPGSGGCGCVTGVGSGGIGALAAAAAVWAARRRAAR